MKEVNIMDQNTMIFGLGLGILALVAIITIVSAWTQVKMKDDSKSEKTLKDD